MFPVNLTIDDSSPLITYQPQEGVWFQRDPQNERSAPNYRDQTLTVTYTLNASAFFSFNGTSLIISGGKRPEYGSFTITIDDSKPLSLTANAEVEKYQQTLFEVDNLKQGLHHVVLTHTDTEGRGFDIDSITWVSNVLSDKNETETSAPPVMVFQDTQKDAFVYSPKGSWNSQPRGVLGFAEGTGRSTSQLGASMNFTFTGEVVCLYGTTGPSNTRAYTVQIDSGPPQTFSARRAVQRQKQMLYHVDGLSPGIHTVIMTNGNGHDKRFRFSSRQDDGNLLEFDYATVWSTEAQRSLGSAVPTLPSPTVTPKPSKVETDAKLGPGAIAGISVACIFFLGLLVALWALNRRNKTLWMRLQKGYMVQCQFDSQTTLVRPPGNSQTRQTLAPPARINLDRNNNSSHILPILSSEALRSRESALTMIEQSYPFTGFGRDRTTSKSSTEASQSTTSSTPGNPYPDRAYPVRATENENDGLVHGEDGAPVRSGTLDTVSTLVAENGSQVTSEDHRSSWKIFPRLATPRSPKGMNPPPTPTPTLASISSGSHSSRRHTLMRLKPRTARSTSPSATRLLPDQDHDPAGSGSDGEIDQHDVEEANYYASEAPFFDNQRGSPSMSVAITQSDIQTPVRGRYSSLRSTVLGSIPTRVDEEYDRELAEAAQSQNRVLLRAQSHRASLHSGDTIDEHHQNFQDSRNAETSTLVDVPVWMDHPPVESPPPLYTSNRTSLADRHHGETDTPSRP